MADMILKQESI